MNKIKIKRIYDVPSKDDSNCILTDRTWPRGVSQEEAKQDDWNKDITPSIELRKMVRSRPGQVQCVFYKKEGTR